jgi:ATP-dependent DNA helicase RecQ
LQLLAEGRSFAEIAELRGRQISTVMMMVADLVERGLVQFQASWVEMKNQAMIEAACARLRFSPLTPIPSRRRRRRRLRLGRFGS